VRIALDSSVLIAAHISRAGVCAELLEDRLLCSELVASEFILEELAAHNRGRLNLRLTVPLRTTLPRWQHAGG